MCYMHAALIIVIRPTPLQQQAAAAWALRAVARRKSKKAIRRWPFCFYAHRRPSGVTFGVALKYYWVSLIGEIRCCIISLCCFPISAYNVTASAIPGGNVTFRVEVFFQKIRYSCCQLSLDDFKKWFR